MAPPIRPLRERLLDQREVIGDCWEWQGSYGKDGYGVMSVRRKQKRVHRVAFEVFTEGSAEGRLVCHKCDNPKCFNPDHLFLGTSKDNTQDMIRKGRKAKGQGQKHPKSILTASQVMDIRRKRNEQGMSLKAIASEYSISFQHVSDVARRIKWKHM